MRRLPLLISVLLLMPASAMAAGPVISAGVAGTRTAYGQHPVFDGLKGGSYTLGFEIGQRLRNEWSFSQTVLSGSDFQGTRTLTLSGFGYQMSFHFRPRGFSPYIGLGLEMGGAVLERERLAGELYTYTDRKEGPYLSGRAVLGLRYQMQCGLGFRLELVGSTFGKLAGIYNNLGISYSY